jgi:threonine dehydratase
VGLQVPTSDQGALRTFLTTLNYPWADETANPVYRMFLR